MYAKKAADLEYVVVIKLKLSQNTFALFFEICQKILVFFLTEFCSLSPERELDVDRVHREKFYKLFGLGGKLCFSVRNSLLGMKMGEEIQQLIKLEKLLGSK